MKQSSWFCRALVLVSLTVFVPGCSRNPNVRKQKYLESGERYFAKGQYSAATIQFGNAIQVDARYAPAHYQLARTYLRLREWTDANEELQRTLDLQPENYGARLDLANLLIASGDLKQAQEQVELLSAKQPADSQVHVAIASLHAAQEDFPGAMQELQKAIALDPSQGGTYLDLALLQLKTGQPNAAEVNFRKAIQLAPKTINARLALGNYYQSHRRCPEAEQEFRSAVEIDRHNLDARSTLARLYLLEGEKAKAVDFLKESKRDFPNNSVGYRMLGDFYFATGDLDSAAAEYKILYREHSTDLQVNKNYVQILILKNHLGEARQLNDAILKTNPSDMDALIERGQIQVAGGHPSDAFETLQAAIKNDPENGLAYYHIGVACDRLGNLAQAESAWQNAVRHRPALVEAHRALALAALRKGNMAELERFSSEVVNLQPASPEGYSLRAVSYLRRGQLSEAERDVLKAIEVSPQSPLGYVQMGNLMLARGRYRDAEQAYQQALDRDSRSSDALAGLMNTYLVQNQTGNALGAARAQILKVPDDSAFYDLLGTALFDHKLKQQDLDSAVETLEKSIQLDNHNTDASLKLSRVQAARGSTDEAIVTCQRSIADNPREASLYVLLGQLYESKPNWDRAKEAYQKVLELNPQHPLASNNLAYVMLETGGSPDLAMSLAATARRGMPDSPQPADTMGWVFYQKGAYQSAIDLFQEALKLGEKEQLPDNPTVHFHLGLAYQRAGRFALARRHLERVLKLDPNYSGAENVRKLLAQLQS